MLTIAGEFGIEAVPGELTSDRAQEYGEPILAIVELTVPVEVHSQGPTRPSGSPPSAVKRTSWSTRGWEG